MTARTKNTRMIERQIRKFAEKSERILTASLQRMSPAERALTEKRVEAFWALIAKKPTISDIRSEGARKAWKKRKSVTQRAAGEGTESQ